ncbi:MAG TPA: tetratricopeptide repeat protein [Chloroflexota bacterium]|nr:tetratricopeptide repeat protein [Chloroflexota bacterium]
MGIDPNDADTCNNLGCTFKEARRTDEAEQRFRQALAIDPKHPQALFNLGNLLANSGRVLEAVPLLELSVAVRPEWAEAHFSLGSALHDLGDLDRAVTSYRHALAIAPNYILAHVCLGLSLLLHGDWIAGWEEYEWRWRAKEFRDTLPGPPEQRWDGSELVGRDILVFAEQGLGDTLQFVRYLPLLHLGSRQVFLQCQPPLKRLLSSIEGADVVIGTDDPPPRFDCYVPLMSLARMFETTPAHIPGKSVYLSADTALRHRWKPRLPDHGLRVGLAWAGNPEKTKDCFRSMPLAALAPLGRVPGASLVSLQPEPQASELRAAGLPITDIGSKLGDFADTAAVVSQLDLVITVDTAVAHLAGAMVNRSGFFCPPHLTGVGWPAADRPNGMSMRGSSGSSA